MGGSCSFTVFCICWVMGDETLEQVAQRGSGGPIPGNIGGQVGWGSE